MTEQAIKTAQNIEFERILRTHERKAKQAIIKQKAAELIAEGVEKMSKSNVNRAYYHGIVDEGQETALFQKGRL